MTQTPTVINVRHLPHALLDNAAAVFASVADLQFQTVMQHYIMEGPDKIIKKENLASWQLSSLNQLSREERALIPLFEPGASRARMDIYEFYYGADEATDAEFWQNAHQTYPLRLIDGLRWLQLLSEAVALSSPSSNGYQMSAELFSGTASTPCETAAATQKALGYVVEDLLRLFALVDAPGTTILNVYEEPAPREALNDIARMAVNCIRSLDRIGQYLDGLGPASKIEQAQTRATDLLKRIQENPDGLLTLYAQSGFSSYRA
jgi:hypothetical protein